MALISSKSIDNFLHMTDYIKRSELQLEPPMWGLSNLLVLKGCLAMNNFHDPFESSSSSQNEKVEPGDLLEESWFFGNLLDRKTRMLRCFSDPCSSSNNYNHDSLIRDSNGENSSSMNKVPETVGFVGTKLVRAPSMPNSRSKGEENRENQEKEALGSRYISKSTPRSSRYNLLRTPSLPPCLGKEEVFEDRESEFSMGKLIRQASLNPSDLLPPKHSSKGMKQSSSIQRHVWERKPELESINMDGCKALRRRNVLNQMKMRKSLSDLESEEVKGFRDLGFKFEKQDLNKNVVKVIPGLQDKNKIESEEDNVKRPYLSEAWLEQSSAPPMPKWVDKRSEEDIKSQIKFWARAVASNVRQEC